MLIYQKDRYELEQLNKDLMLETVELEILEILMSEKTVHESK